MCWILFLINLRLEIFNYFLLLCNLAVFFFLSLSVLTNNFVTYLFKSYFPFVLFPCQISFNIRRPFHRFFFFFFAKFHNFSMINKEISIGGNLNWNDNRSLKIVYTILDDTFLLCNQFVKWCNLCWGCNQWHQDLFQFCLNF